ncbi:hypothetical protein ASC61_00540 [Aeromicrobium sp. Root344]|uniref:toll/interleukin-1 receptor domain-containing protein n=1 Tax=Aeromicrobium sp. Root344 TaxID=1736521 RepID=UPI0006F51BBB|nr:toll/interleukin-1 receptor domain-containing protein [Aeromicrobium sp. Root344]KQV73625.1 hypothetical protein ASC61_00540 [Aeromicrobium sp. Root344]
MPIDPTPIQLFLSYARSDDEEFGFVDPFVSKLKALVKAKSGRALDVFVDRDAIGWGENWRDRLEESVQGATVFVPLLTATYLERPACREEFLTFHTKAQVLGVTELLLPVLVFQSPLFGPDSTDDVAAIAEERQYECIEDALLDGYDSSTWLTQMSKLAEKLIEALLRAETALGEASENDASLTSRRRAGSEASPNADDDDDDRAGLAEHMIEMQRAIDEMGDAANHLNPTITALGSVPGEVGDLPDDPSPKQLQTWTTRLALAFKQPALDLERDGKRMFAAAKRLDEALSGIKQVSIEIGETNEDGPLAEGLRTVISGFGDLSSVEQSMEGLLTAMKPAETFSVPLRKSLRPARRGVTSVRDTIQLVATWRSLLDHLEEPSSRVDS